MAAAVTEGTGFERCYDDRLKAACSQLATELYGQSFVEPSRPVTYTGELFGIEYLYSQTGQSFSFPSADKYEAEDVDVEESEEQDEGFQDVEDLTVPLEYVDEPGVVSLASVTTEPPTTTSAVPEATVSVAPTSLSSSDDEGHADRPSGQEAVDRLAAYLVTLDYLSYLTTRQQQTVIRLWNDLDDSDKRRVTYTPRYQSRLVSGRFRRVKMQRVVPGVRRAFVGPRTQAQRPQLSRVVDAICSQLLLKYRRPSTLKTSRGRLLVPKWSKVMDGYTHIKHLVDNSASIRSDTTLQLFSINMHTLRQWYELITCVLLSAFRHCFYNCLQLIAVVM